MTELPPVQDEVRLIVADDDDLVRAGIVALLRTDPALAVVAQAGDGHAALDAVRRHRADLMLLDIRMPGLDGLRTLEHLRHEHPLLPVAMLTTFTDEGYIAEAVSLGALGFLLKSDGPRELITAVKAIAAGHAAFSPRVARWLVRAEATARIRRGRSARTLVDTLTARQREVLAELATGASNAEIARRLHLTDGTVKQYLRGLFERLGTENRVQAAILAHEAGLPEQHDTRS
ncbi:response regulator transcription factor [Nonomuraea terrae]|uniref:Response regulator transcription factor n=1 Tax=Nonomuraea terrae TaxID=2530383 RepID=A0A4R4XUK7_9ACTN|nr:response regulator transcription factor [Nonomuraea terrae]TDD34834.1 response regulator transcription factor [Nonomuraea terrae]